MIKSNLLLRKTSDCPAISCQPAALGENCGETSGLRRERIKKREIDTKVKKRQAVDTNSDADLQKEWLGEKEYKKIEKQKKEKKRLKEKRLREEKKRKQAEQKRIKKEKKERKRLKREREKKEKERLKKKELKEKKSSRPKPVSINKKDIPEHNSARERSWTAGIRKPQKRKEIKWTKIGSSGKTKEPVSSNEVLRKELQESLELAEKRLRKEKKKVKVSEKDTSVGAEKESNAKVKNYYNQAQGYYNKGEYSRALDVIRTAKKDYPGESSLVKLEESVKDKMKEERIEDHYNEGIMRYRTGFFRCEKRIRGNT